MKNPYGGIGVFFEEGENHEEPEDVGVGSGFGRDACGGWLHKLL